MQYDVALLDLDGVLYLGKEAIPHVAPALRAARSDGMRLAFVTNNAMRTPAEVAEHLAALGVPASPDEVVTSSQAAAAILSERLPAGAAVMVVGGRGLQQAVRGAGFSDVTSADDDPAAVVQGLDPDITYQRLAEAALAVRRGVLWVATNRDLTLPTPRGLLPGNGALVALVAAATGRTPEVAGKPERALHAESIRRSHATRPLVVGDRLDTDIEAAVRWQTPSMLVLTGVTSPLDLLSAAQHRRPDYLADDLRGLIRTHPEVASVGTGWRCGGWIARVQHGWLHFSRASGGRPNRGARRRRGRRRWPGRPERAARRLHGGVACAGGHAAGRHRQPAGAEPPSRRSSNRSRPALTGELEPRDRQSRERSFHRSRMLASTRSLPVAQAVVSRRWPTVSATRSSLATVRRMWARSLRPLSIYSIMPSRSCPEKVTPISGIRHEMVRSAACRRRTSSSTSVKRAARW